MMLNKISTPYMNLHIMTISKSIFRDKISNFSKIPIANDTFASINDDLYGSFAIASFEGTIHFIRNQYSLYNNDSFGNQHIYHRTYLSPRSAYLMFKNKCDFCTPDFLAADEFGLLIHTRSGKKNMEAISERLIEDSCYYDMKSLTKREDFIIYTNNKYTFNRNNGMVYNFEESMNNMKRRMSV